VRSNSADAYSTCRTEYRKNGAHEKNTIAQRKRDKQGCANGWIFTANAHLHEIKRRKTKQAMNHFCGTGNGVFIE
jgi:hypothetical protein